MSTSIVNGELTDVVSISDRGFQYGDGVFETFVVEKGVPQHWDAHMQRLSSGCSRLKIAKPDNSHLKSELDKLLNQQSYVNEKRLVVKITVTRGLGRRGYKPPPQPEVTRIISAFPFPDYPQEYFTQGVRITVCKIPLSCNPVLAGIKHLNRLEQVMAQDEWQDSDIIDGVMLNSDQQIIECTMSNIFWVTDNQLFTPDLSHCGVEGVTRANILRLAEELQIPITIGNFELKDLLAADEIMISNSVFGILPVKSVDDHQLNPGSLTQRLMNQLV